MKNKQGRIILLLLVLFVLLLVAEHYAPRPVSWNYTFNASHTMPYGCRVLRKELLPALFNKKVDDNTVTFYEGMNVERSPNSSLVIVTSEFNPDKLDLDAMLNYAGTGNHVFISAFDFSKHLLDTLGIKTLIVPLDTGMLKQKKSTLNLVNHGFKKQNGFVFNRNLTEHCFTAFDTSCTVVLGVDSREQADFIKVHFKDGYIYLHCQPGVFTNYHLLYSNYHYASYALSYLPETNVTWDEYYKPYRSIIRTPVRYILSQKSLRAAYYLIIFGIIIYMLFEGKRRQRPVPVIKPLKNNTLEFVETVARLYMRSKDYRDLILKKITFFNEQLHTRYSINMADYDEKKIEALSRKSGVDISRIRDIYSAAETITNRGSATVEELSGICRRINDFNKQAY
ncbi:MAG: DUF4350 domain-containing protein [Bacteroidales bacterium]|nr:DUF4350 domain-containing protein [Bacteroidales bacterium]